jgi:hypothetical protein
MANYSINKTKFAIATLASGYFLYYCYTFKDWHFIDNVNLIIHEAGHSLFIFFGQFINMLGGSFLQVIFPLVFVLYFLYREEYFSASLLLFWVGQNLINVSVYISDAIVMQLPLLGGDSSLHDWNNILQSIGLLKYTEKIGSAVFAIGFLIIIAAIYFSFRNSYSSPKPPVLLSY